MLAPPSPLVTLGRPTCHSAPVAVHRRWRGHGQGKTATTIVADQGDYVTIITDVPYSERSRTSRPQTEHRVTKGSRPMHRSTLTVPCQSYTDYTTTVQANHGGSKTKDPPERRYPFPSAHISQIAFGNQQQQQQQQQLQHRPCYTQYRCNYFSKDIGSPRSLKLPEFTNKLSMTEGCGMKRSMTAPTGTGTGQPSYWTQYARIHNKLGVMLGPGVTRQLPVRRAYNPITGEDLGGAWQEGNRRISGNRVLYNGYRKDAEKQFILG